MTKFRKRPEVIEAIQWNGKNRVEVARFIMGDRLTPDDRLLIPGARILIDTLEGQMFAIVGDWIIRGIKGEIYPCKPHIFEETYDVVEE